MTNERDFYDEVRSVLQEWSDAGASADDIAWQVDEIVANLED